MSDSIAQIPAPRNEPVKPYAPGDDARVSLKAELARQAGEIIEIPCIVGGRRVETGEIVEIRMPHNHQHVLARVHLADEAVVNEAIDTALRAQRAWAAMPWEERSSIFLRAAALLAGPWRDRLNASTMLGQSKTCHQAEIDSACELIDFWRFNAHYLEQIYADQPGSNPGMWNRLEYRPLEGFVFAVTPFNFTSIALNLPTAPAMAGNVSVWKPSLTQSLSAWYGMLLLEEAGVPPGVINLVHGHGADVGDPALASPHLAGLHFTGSTPTFQHLWKTIGNNIAGYHTYPRIVGETGGKDFIIAHPSANLDALATAMLRGGFEFQGQKCSAASRTYIPKSLWAPLQERLTAQIGRLKMGDIQDFSNFLGAVIDERAFTRHQKYQQIAKETGEVLAGGGSNGEVGWFVEPTWVKVDDPRHVLMREEIFGPILTTWVYEDSQWEQALELVDKTSPYGLTGAVFARDRYAATEAKDVLRQSAGNFYINDKPTGAVVGQQPFGGARGSGTNDKAGSRLNLLRWISPRTIKENLTPPTDWGYAFLDRE
ncbi:MAG: L-glutamate gamma-semialdehyde dehydrogenase [Myxococcota bacterium]